MTTQTAAVIIATTGRPTLRRAVQSVIDQTHSDTVAVVVVDGPQFGPATLEALEGMLPHPRVQLLPLPQNTGAGGYMGHRIYGAVPQLLNQDWLFFLDDDNWYEPDHVAECVGSCVTHGLSWCAAMRKIYEPSGALLCVDECESLAVVPIPPGVVEERLPSGSTNRCTMWTRIASACRARWPCSLPSTGIGRSASTGPNISTRMPMYSSRMS